MADSHPTPDERHQPNTALAEARQAIVEIREAMLGLIIQRAALTQLAQEQGVEITPYDRARVERAFIVQIELRVPAEEAERLQTFLPEIFSAKMEIVQSFSESAVFHGEVRDYLRPEYAELQGEDIQHAVTELDRRIVELNYHTAEAAYRVGEAKKGDPAFANGKSIIDQNREDVVLETITAKFDEVVDTERTATQRDIVGLVRHMIATAVLVQQDTTLVVLEGDRAARATAAAYLPGAKMGEVEDFRQLAEWTQNDHTAVGVVSTVDRRVKGELRGFLREEAVHVCADAGEKPNQEQSAYVGGYLTRLGVALGDEGMMDLGGRYLERADILSRGGAAAALPGEMVDAGRCGVIGFRSHAGSDPDRCMYVTQASAKTVADREQDFSSLQREERGQGWARGLKE